MHCTNHFVIAETLPPQVRHGLVLCFSSWKTLYWVGGEGKERYNHPPLERMKLVKTQSILSYANFRRRGSLRATSKWPSYRRHKWPARKLCSSFEHLPKPPAHLQQTTSVGLSANDVKYVEVVFDRHLKIVEGIHSLNGSICDKQKQKSVKGLVSEGTMVLRRRGSGAQKFDIRQVEKGQMSNTNRQRSWCFER